MKKYRKKPVEIEAIQYPGWMTEEIKNFLGDSLISESRWGDEGGPVGYFIKTLEGTSYMLDRNDWVIKGVKGEFYPCKPDVFEKTYESVDTISKEDAYRILHRGMFHGAFNANDFFHWAAAQSVNIVEEDFEWIVEHIQKWGNDGLIACIAYVQNQQPQRPLMTEKFNQAIQELVDRKQEVFGDIDWDFHGYIGNGLYRKIEK